MKRVVSCLFGSALVALLMLGGSLAKAGSNPGSASGTSSPRVVADYGALPLSFERNVGQTDALVKFISHGSGYALFLTNDGATLTLREPSKRGAETKRVDRLLPGEAPRYDTVRVKLEGANRAASVSGEDQLPGRVNYFIGNDPNKWRTGIPSYGRVRFHDVYRGVDVVYHGSDQQKLEYDFVVAPGADPDRIRLNFEGVRSVRLDHDGNLMIAAARGEVVERAPAIYQKVDGHRRSISGGWILRGRRAAGFRVSSYDRRRSLVIDPTLVYSTYLGGSGVDVGRDIAVDSSDNAYVCGYTASTNFPTMNPLQGANAGGSDAFVAKLNAAGSALVYSTYLGGSNGDSGQAIALDSAGNAYVAGQTCSTNFPTMNPIQGANAGGCDAFMTKLNAAGSALVYSTYLGGSGADYAKGIAVDSSGNAYVIGNTYSTDFPTMNPLQAANAGNQDAFVAKLNAAGSALVYSTYLGGSNYDQGFGIAVDSAGNAYVGGLTSSTNFPTMNPIQSANAGGYDAFVAKLNAAGNALVYSTYLGGSNDDIGGPIHVDSSGNAYITGYTASTNFPTMNPIQSANAGGYDAFVTKIGFGPACSVTYNGTFNGNLNITRGLVCIINGTVTGNVTQSGGGLLTSNATIGGNLQITGGGTFSMVSTDVNGDLQIQNIPAGSAQNQICGTHVKGNLTFHNNGTGVAIGTTSASCPGDTIGNDLQVNNNLAAVQVFDDAAGGNLQCSGNSTITGGGDTAKSLQGQCASF